MILSFLAPKKHEFRTNSCLVLAENDCIAAQKRKKKEKQKTIEAQILCESPTSVVEPYSRDIGRMPVYLDYAE